MAIRLVIAGGGTGGHLYPGIAVAREWLARFPDAAISFAGTAKGIEARVLPREGNAVPGLTNRLLARVVRSAAVTFASTQQFFGPKAFVSGNPVRPEFLAAAGTGKEPAPGDGTSATQVLVFGGSQGAHAINV